VEHVETYGDFTPCSAGSLTGKRECALSEVAELTGVSGQTVYNWLQRYLACHQVAVLADAPRSGRPVTAPRVTAAHILQHLRCNPLRLGYRTTVWSVKLLAAHLSRQDDCPINLHTLRRRMKAMG
jgi:transposase